MTMIDRIQSWTPDTDTPKPDSGADYHTVKAWFKQLRTMDDRIDRDRKSVV